MKPKPTIIVHKRQDRPAEQPVVEVRCSCGKRPKHKCIKENGLGAGKMCFL